MSFTIGETPIDIFMTCWNRLDFTKNTIKYLHERTKHPFRIIIIDNASDEESQQYFQAAQHSGEIYHVVHHSKNIGIHQAWNTALGLADNKYFITTDNDIYVPDLDPDWLTQLVTLMENNPDYGAISCQPHAYIGTNDPTPHTSGVVEVSHAGAVMRIMDRKACLDAGGWEKFYNAKRNHEEHTICSRLKTNGYKIGVTSYIRCYHDWGDDNNWGYKDVPPTDHGHRIPAGSKWANGGAGELWPTPEVMSKQRVQFDEKTWERL